MYRVRTLLCLVPLHALLALSAAGCGESGKPSGAVEGRVTFDGKAVPEANVQFQSPETGAAGAGITDGEGKFKLGSPLAVGKYLIHVQPYQEVPPAGSGPAPAPKARPDIPEKYRDPSKSGLSHTVTTGANKVDLDLKSGN